MDEADRTPPPLSTKKKGPSVWFWLSAGTVIGTYLITFVLLLFVVPVFTEMFADFGAELPKSTQITIGLSDFMKSYFLFIQLPTAALLALAIWGLYELDKRKQIVAVIVIGNVPPLMTIIMLIALFLPMVQLIKLLGDGP